MLNKTEIERIKNLPEDSMVLMAVVNVNPAVVNNEADGLPTRAKSMMADAGVPPTLMSRVLNDIERARTEFGKSAIYVVNEDMFERYDVQMDLPERYHYGRPIPAIISNVMEMMPRLGVMAIDREWARFFVFEQGELHEVEREENVRETEEKGWRMQTVQRAPAASAGGVAGSVPGARGNKAPNMAGAADTDYYQDREDANMQRFFNEMAGELDDFVRHYDVKHVVLVGPEERVSKFELELPKHANYEIVGHTNVGSGVYRAQEPQLLEKLMPIVEEYLHTSEDRLMEEIQEHGVMEMETVLEMIQQNRIHKLIIPEDGSQIHIYRSHNHEVPYFTSKKDVAHSPLDNSLMERVSLDTVLHDFISLYGLKVRRVHGENAEKLVKAYGGLAGIPRF